MNNRQEEILQKAAEELKNVYNSYHSQGLEAVYLWGSILRDDFKPESSDIDSIGIADDSMDFALEKQIQTELAGRIPGLSKFGFRLIYKSELSGGKIKGFLSSVQSPKSHLLDLPNWQFIEGKRFQQSDFAKKLPTYLDAAKAEISELRKHQEKYKEHQVDDYPHFIKKIAQIVDLLQKQRGARGRFSYHDIVSKAPEGSLEKQVALALGDIKNSGYNIGVIKKHELLLHEFIEFIYTLE